MAPSYVGQTGRPLNFITFTSYQLSSSGLQGAWQLAPRLILGGSVADPGKLESWISQMTSSHRRFLPAFTMKHLVALFAISLVTTATKAADPAVACGEPTDPCMNNENWALCQVLVEDGCQDIAVMESCPLQFACNDDATAGACVTLNVYEDKYFCTGDPIITLSFPTSTAKGGPCCKCSAKGSRRENSYATCG